MPPIVITGPSSPSILGAQVLRQDVFSSFGTVIENSDPALVPSATIKQLPPNAVLANQGSAIKHKDVTRMLDLYDSAPSKVPSKAVMNMFICAPRELLPGQEEAAGGLFPIRILERHPFTTQTFIPLGMSPSDQLEARYLVIVAPSREPSNADQLLPVPAKHKSEQLPGRGLPDLTKIQAFIAKGSQAVTYGAGTWHAPMVVVGKKSVDFVVVQFANGEDIEDCQEVILDGDRGSQLQVAVPKVALGRTPTLMKL